MAALPAILAGAIAAVAAAHELANVAGGKYSIGGNNAGQHGSPGGSIGPGPSEPGNFEDRYIQPFSGIQIQKNASDYGSPGTNPVMLTPPRSARKISWAIRSSKKQRGNDQTPTKSPESTLLNLRLKFPQSETMTMTETKTKRKGSGRIYEDDYYGGRKYYAKKARAFRKKY